MILIVDLVLSVCGFVFFLVAGILLLAAVDYKKIPNPYQLIVYFSDTEKVLAAIVAFVLMIIFLYVAIYLLCLLKDIGCLKFLQTKSFQELIVILDYNADQTRIVEKESRVITRAAIEYTSEEEEEMGEETPQPSEEDVLSQEHVTGMQGDAPVERRIATEADVATPPSARRHSPIRTPSRLPNWKAAPPDQAETIGLAIDKNGNWSHSGNLPVWSLTAP